MNMKIHHRGWFASGIFSIVFGIVLLSLRAESDPFYLRVWMPVVAICLFAVGGAALYRSTKNYD
ncbi:hypothetical protein [Paenibacillus medicaginis]|uniref:DUF5668 domain-containing protein n=1 Tax=Paenibacillus medicaginis TaxID=1470560 RepID=A0ABV5BUW2_9BACL